jgi:uncharacterized protein (TIGR00369 family)
LKKPALTQPSASGSALKEIRSAIARGEIPPVAALIGFRLTAIARGSARIELDADGRHENPMGTLHGGVICDIADAAMGMAYASLLDRDESFATVELKVNFLRPFWKGRLEARGSVIRKGRIMGLMSCRVTDEKRRLVAFATGTCMTLRGPDADGIKRTRRDEGSR